MLDFAKKSEAAEFLIATEGGMLERLKREIRGKKFFALAGECAEMKKITLPKILHSLENDEFEVEVDAVIMRKAYESLAKMIELTKK